MEESVTKAVRVSPYVLAPGQPVTHDWDWQPQMRMLATGDQTAGAFGVADCTYDGSRFGPPLHIHQNDDECIFVMEGTVTLQLDEDVHELVPGSFAWMPRHIPHSFANLSGEPIRVIGFGAPSGFEHMLTAIGNAVMAGEMDPAHPFDLPTEIGEKYGFTVIGPPAWDQPGWEQRKPAQA